MSNTTNKSFSFVFTMLLLCASQKMFAQNFKLGYTQPNTSNNPSDPYYYVGLEVEGVDKTTPKGTLISRMTATDRDNIVAAPQGMLVYVTNGGNPGFYFNASTNNTPQWERILTGNNNSSGGIFTVTDTVLRFSNSNSVVKINTLQNNALEIGNAGTSYIKIPETMGSSNTQTGMVITDRGDFSTSASALVSFNSLNKGVLLPRVSNFGGLTLPPLGLMVILRDPNNSTKDGVYIQMGAPNAPSWQRITTAIVP